MLYHWYEPGQASMAPARASAKVGELAPTPPRHPLSYDHHAAKAAARGAALRLDAEDFGFTAANDAEPDPTVGQLERAGLGLIGDPRHRAQPADYDIWRQTRKLWRVTMAFVIDSLSGFADSRRNSRSVALTHRGHTPASSSVHRVGSGTVDADRQRQVRSKQQHVN